MNSLPRGWRMRTLQDVADWSSGGTPKARTREYYGGDIPWAVIGDLRDGLVSDTSMTITEEGLRNSSAKVVPANTVLIAMYGSIGKLGIAAHNMATNQAIACARVTAGIDHRFLFYYLLSQRDALQAAGKGGTQRNISQSVLKPWPIPVPDSLEEQRRIVEVLEDHLSRLDAAERSLADARKRLEVIGVAHLTNVRSHLAGSEIRRIAELADTTLGKMLDAKKQVGVPTPYLRNINVRWGAFDLSDLQTTPLTDADRLRLELRDGDVLACEGGEPGRNAVWRRNDSGIAFQKALHRLRVHDPSSVLPEYLSLMLTEAIRSGRCDKLFTGTTIKHLPQEKLRAIEIPLPDVETQQRLVAEHRALSESASRLAAAVQSGSLRMNQLRRSLLAMAFSGRMTTPHDGVVSATEEENP